jgi:hypothetical protein
VRRPRFAAATAVILAGVFTIAGCGPPIPTAASPSPPPAASAPASSSFAAPPPSAAGAVALDPGLLDLLPDEVGGQALQPDDATAADLAANGGLAADIEAIAVGLYIQPGSSTADDLAIVNVVRLRPGVFGDAWFRSWRSTYDDGACEVAGGVTPGAAVTEIGGHETHIGSCQGGVHTYHIHLANPDRIVSITAAGEGRFGERVIEGLTE